jgi:uncharacterized protein (TIGR03435 family)
LYLNMTARAAPRLRIGALFLCVTAIASLPPIDAMAQAGPPGSNAQEASAQPPAFEVAAIKPDKSGDSGSHTNFNNGRFSATNVTVKRVIEYEAYDIPEKQIEGGPAWLGSDRFDIEAKMDDATFDKMHKLSRDERNLLSRQLFQQLLADRFKLVVHWETRQLPVYALVIAKSGSKLERSKIADGGTSFSSGNGKLTAKGVTMDKLAQTLTSVLSRELDRMVVDQTGITGTYDIVLAWSPADRSAVLADASTGNGEPAGPSIFTALQEQAGLKLVSAKAAVQTLVVDHVEQPSAN